MQHLKNDMDDLFKRAAEAYPLNTSGADWTNVLQKLQTTETVKERGNDNRRFLWLLLLLPFGFLCNRDWIGESYEQFSEAGGNKPVQLQKHAPVTTKQNNGVQNDVEQPATTKAGADKFSSTAEFSFLNGTDRLHAKAAGEGAIAARTRNEESRNNVKRTTVFNNASGEESTAKQTAPVNNASTSANTNSSNNRLVLQIEDKHYGLNGFRWPLAKDKNIAPQQEEPDTKSISRVKKFYAGVLGGIDFTTVRFQRFEQPGFDVGALLGYKISQRISIESGLIYNKKLYYSNGEYLDPAKFYLAPGSKLTKLEGTCSMWEIPLTVRYTFPSERKKSWFVGAGVANYIMKQEGYDYSYVYASGGAPHRRYYAHSVTKTEWLSALQISGGYQRAIGKANSLRVEPFIKLPLKKIGSVDLPMQSSGLRVAFTRTLF